MKRTNATAKPSNLMRTEEDTVKLADFGLARLLVTSDAGMTATGSVLGTPYFMSPEQRGRATEANWNATGVVLSDKSARKECGLAQNEILDAVRDGKLQYRENHIHGNPYLRLLRKEVEAFAKNLRGTEVFERQKLVASPHCSPLMTNRPDRRLINLRRSRCWRLPFHGASACPDATYRQAGFGEPHLSWRIRSDTRIPSQHLRHRLPISHGILELGYSC